MAGSTRDRKHSSVYVPGRPEDGTGLRPEDDGQLSGILKRENRIGLWSVAEFARSSWRMLVVLMALHIARNCAHCMSISSSS
jgi:hypothetical protein